MVQLIWLKPYPSADDGMFAIPKIYFVCVVDVLESHRNKGPNKVRGREREKERARVCVCVCVCVCREMKCVSILKIRYRGHLTTKLMN